MKKVLVLLSLIIGMTTNGFAQNLPAAEAEAIQRIESSPRHGEWVKYTAAGSDSVDAWVVFPERSDSAPVVVVIHEIFGLNDWARAVADQFAAEGFIAIAPDFLSGKGPGGGGTSTIPSSDVRSSMSKLTPEEVNNRIDYAVKYATGLPSATGQHGVVGFCWGGAASFAYATRSPNLSAAIAFYGTSPATEALAGVRSPVLGLYGGNDNRVNATIPDAEAQMKKLGKSFEKEIYDGAGHAFLRQQDGQNGANQKATELAWPRAVEFLEMHLE